MSRTRKSTSPTQTAGKAAGTLHERRRRGLIVHDDRGNARLEWVQAPLGVERTSLALEDPQPARQGEQGYDPYASVARAPQKPGPTQGRARRDLRKLSEWIKQVRRVEALKQAQGGEEEPQT